MQALLSETGGVVKPAGLGARDTLRVEAGLCLYGQDIDENTTPVEASLLWTIGKRRRAEGGFPGAKIILDQVKNKPPMKRVGFVVNGAPARSHTKLFASETASDDQAIGEILSGTFSPSLGKPVAMGYVEHKYGANDTTVYAKVRNKMVPVVVSKMPFVPANYYRGPGTK
jgi:aminomethyltransferase